MSDSFIGPHDCDLHTFATSGSTITRQALPSVSNHLLSSFIQGRYTRPVQNLLQEFYLWMPGLKSSTLTRGLHSPSGSRYWSQCSLSEFSLYNCKRGVISENANVERFMFYQVLLSQFKKFAPLSIPLYQINTFWSFPGPFNAVSE